MRQFWYSCLFLFPSFFACLLNFIFYFSLYVFSGEGGSAILSAKFYLSNGMAYILIPASVYLISEGKVSFRKISPFILMVWLFALSEFFMSKGAAYLAPVFPILNLLYGAAVIYLILKKSSGTEIPVFRRFLKVLAWYNIAAIIISLTLSLLPFSINGPIFDAAYFIPLCFYSLILSSRYFFKPVTDQLMEIPEAVIELYGLKEREIQIAGLLLQGYTSREISERIHLTQQVIKNYISRMYRKAGVNSKQEFTAAVLGEGFQRSRLLK